MAVRHSNFRAATCWLLLSMLSGVLPVVCAAANPTVEADIARHAALESAAPDAGSPTGQDSSPTSSAQRPAVEAPAIIPAKRHSGWKWIAIIGGVAVAAGVAIILTNKQSGHTTTTSPTATVGVGGPTAGGPH
jgi:hypothetical protein